MSAVPHEFGPVEVDAPRRPMDWDAYSWSAVVRCARCRHMLVAEFLIPGPVMHLIPSEERDKAARLMEEFVRRRMAWHAQLAAEYPFPPCKERA